MPVVRHITLIRPSTVVNQAALAGRRGWPSLSLAYLAAAARDAGYAVTVLDAQGEGLGLYTPLPESSLFIHGLTIEQLLERIPKDTQFIGFSCMFSNEWIHHKHVINAVSANFSNIPIVVGGEHPTAAGEYVLKCCPGVIACAMGEGEETLLDVLDAISNDRTLHNVPGLLLRDSQDEPVATSPRNRVRHLDELPWPAWDLLPIEQYLDEGIGHGVMRSRNMPMLASRGCPYRCTFCSNPRMWGKLWNVRSASDVVAEMKYYKERYGANSFSFYDLTAIIRKDWILEFTNLLIQQKLDVQWLLPTGTRAEALDQDVMRNLKASGCLLMNFAPESGSPRVLKMIRKQVDLKKMLASMRAGTREGIITNAHIIMGMPGETLWDLTLSVWFVFRMALAGVNDVSVFQFAPYPGSVMFNELRASGRFPMDGEESDHIMAVNQCNSWGNIRSWNENISGRQLSSLLVLTAALFYSTQFILRPWRVIRMVVRVASAKPTTLLERVIYNMTQQIAETSRTRWWGKPAVAGAPIDS